MISKANNPFLIIALFLLIIVIGNRFYQYVFLGSFLVEVNTSCDSQKANRFTNDFEDSVEPYKKVLIRYSYVPSCLEEHSCKEFSCTGYSPDGCSEIYCEDSSLEEGEKCLIPDN